MERVHAGAGNLTDALSHWLIPRHAAQFERAVLTGKILFWIEIMEADDERRAYQNLLAHGSDCVGFHDLALQRW